MKKLTVLFTALFMCLTLQAKEAAGITVKGDDFGRTLLKIWLGEKPADRNLKNAMLKG